MQTTSRNVEREGFATTGMNPPLPQIPGFLFSHLQERIPLLFPTIVTFRYQLSLFCNDLPSIPWVDPVHCVGRDSISTHRTWKMRVKATITDPKDLSKQKLWVWVCLCGMMAQRKEKKDRRRKLSYDQPNHKHPVCSSISVKARNRKTSRLELSSARRTETLIIMIGVS